MKNLMSGSQNRRAIAFAALAAVALFAAGCSQQQAAADKEGAEARAAQRNTPTVQTQILPAGTNIVAALQGTIDTGKNHAGDKIALRTLEDVRVNEMMVVPAGATINGEVTHVDPAGRVAGGAELTLRYTELVMLGYRDSGMPDSAENADPRAFANAPLDQAVGRLVAIIRRTPPAGDHHLRRRSTGLPPPGPPSGARHFHRGVGGRWRS